MHPSKQGLDDNLFNEVVSVDDEPLLGDSRRDEENEGILDALDSSSSGGEIVLIDISSHSQGTKNGGIDSTYVDQPQCRICLDTGGDDLIAPCKCKGTQKFVHRSCLDNWRAAKEGFAFSHCTECKTLFHLRANVPSDRRWSRLKFQFLVLRDHAAVFVVVMLVVASLAFLVYKFNGDELREMFGYEQHPYGFYAIAAWNEQILKTSRNRTRHMLSRGGRILHLPLKKKKSNFWYKWSLEKKRSCNLLFSLNFCFELLWKQICNGPTFK